MHFSDISAVIVTRGDVDLDPILKTLPYEDIVIWDNSQRHDQKIFGRYAAIPEARNEIIYFQDDDVIFTEHEQLLAEYEPGKIVASMDAAWVEAGRYHNLVLMGAGSLCQRDLPAQYLGRYLDNFPADDLFLYECDPILGTLAPWKRVDLGYKVRDDIFRDGTNRLCDQPWQEEWKWRAIRRAERICFFAPVTENCGPDCEDLVRRWQEWWRKRLGEPLAMLSCNSPRKLGPKARNKLRRSAALYDYREFDYNSHREQIDIVNQSKPIRQGKPMQGWYTKPAEPTSKAQLCDNHRDVWYGAFRKEGGELAAYCHFIKLGDLGVINSILAHAQTVGAINGMIEYMAENADVRWINYLRLNDDSLGDFKRSVGFEEAWYE